MKRMEDVRLAAESTAKGTDGMTVTQREESGARATAKRVVAPLLLAFSLFAAYVTVFAVPGAWFPLAVLTMLLPPALTLLVALMGALLLVAWFWRRHWASGAAMLCGLVALAVAVAVPNQADSAANWASSLVDVVVYANALQQQPEYVAAGDGSTPLAVLPLDGFGSMTSGIAWDPGGEIMLPPAQRSPAWREAASETDLSADGLEVHHIIGGYYSWFHY